MIYELFLRIFVMKQQNPKYVKLIVKFVITIYLIIYIMLIKSLIIIN